MKKELLKISIRNQAIFLKDIPANAPHRDLNEMTSVLVANAKKLGFAFSESLLQAINVATPTVKLDVLEVLKEITGVNKNWTPLVRGWDIPTGESYGDHVVTFFSNLFGVKQGTTLPCNHVIPPNTFPLERYNGCPFCGTPFQAGKLKNFGQGSKMKVLELWTEEDMISYFSNLLSSRTALDATQVDSLKILLSTYDIPEGAGISMKETLMLVSDALIEMGEIEKAGSLFKTPTDILRYLWFKHTGFLQIIEPKTIVQRKGNNAKHIATWLDKSTVTGRVERENLKLKYSRKTCRMVAQWMNGLEMTPEAACENMHPKRNMWIRFIRALRLVEYSKKKGFENLATLLEMFHQEKYEVFQGRVNHFRLRSNPKLTFRLLKNRPGLFARSLFANILWFGLDETLVHFEEVAEKIPSRLLLSLNMYAKYYFTKNGTRSVQPLGGTRKKIPTHPLLELYTDKQVKTIRKKIEALSFREMKVRYAKIENENHSVYIEKRLYHMPLAIGDRSETIQDLPSASMGMRFPVEGTRVRLFMQWGNGLPAQHLDMDLSCKVAYANKVEFCSYSQLVTTGCKHSGDIQRIPHMIGTAEYIEIDLDELAKAKARYVSFTCNAYSQGSISPELVVGWMDSKYPMKISNKTGVAYDPSCVQHQVRVTRGNVKGLLFGVLDVKRKEIIWMEMAFGGQVVQNLDVAAVETLMSKLNSKLTVGKMLKLKAKAQGLKVVGSPEEADEIYDAKWATDTAGVTKVLVV